MQAVSYRIAYLCIEIRKCCINSLECITPYIASAQTYDQLAGMLCYMACHHDHVSYYGPQTAPPYPMLCLCPPPAYGFLPYHAQYVVCHYGKLHHQFVGVKFSGRQTLQIHVCFYFAMELFAFPMRMVMADDLFICHPGVCPPGIGLGLRREKELPVFIDGTFYDLIACADYCMVCCPILRCPGNIAPVASDINRFSFAWA